jgi:hypothetical protein
VPTDFRRIDLNFDVLFNEKEHLLVNLELKKALNLKVFRSIPPLGGSGDERGSLNTAVWTSIRFRLALLPSNCNVVVDLPPEVCTSLL